MAIALVLAATIIGFQIGSFLLAAICACVAALSLLFLFLVAAGYVGWLSGARRRRGTYQIGPALTSHGIFINYRREDTGPYARLLQVQLGQCFPDAPVFMDLDSIEAGVDFAEAIDSAVRSCAVLIVLIGRQWLAIADDNGKRRLDDPDDYVRFEIHAALERGVRVIPVLVDGTRAPQQQQLPDVLHRLARLNPLEMSYGRFAEDEGRLMTIIRKVLESEVGDPADVTGP
jgi:TIR domain